MYIFCIVINFVNFYINTLFKNGRQMEVESYSARIALLIGRSSGGTGLETLPKLDKDLQAIREGLQTIGFRESEIFELNDRNNLELEDDVGAEQIEQIQEFSDVGLPVLLFVFYIGHGVVKKNLVHCVDQQGDDNYNLEGFVLTCAQMPNIYTICIFDCCRRNRGGIQ